MSDLSKPNTITETYLAALTGDYTGELPAPVTRLHLYLAKLCAIGIGSGGDSADLTGIRQQLAALESDIGDIKTALESIVEVDE